MKEKLLFPGTHLQIGLHQVPDKDSPRGVLPDGTGNAMTDIFFSLCSHVLPQIFLDCFSFAVLSVLTTGLSEKELKEGLGCYLVRSLSWKMSSAGSWGAYLGRIRDLKGCRRVAAQEWNKQHFSVSTSK